MAEDIIEVLWEEGLREEKGPEQNSGDHLYLRGYPKKRNYSVIAENLTESNGPGQEFQRCYLSAV